MATPGGAFTAATVARLDGWLETMRSPAGYGGPVVHWWRHNFLYTGVGRDWRYEGIVDGYLSLWERSGDEGWLRKARRAGDDLLGGQGDGGCFAASAFEMNPASGGTPHEAACDVALLLLARSLRQKGDPAWGQYADCAERNLRLYHIGRLWDAEAGAFRDAPRGSCFVPNKAATAVEALFLLAEVREDERWLEHHAFPTLDRIVAYQVRDEGPCDGAIAQNSIGNRRVDKYLPIYIARCVPALMAGYRWRGREMWAECAQRAVGFLARCTKEDGSLPAAVYPGGHSCYRPSWIAPLGDVLRAADQVPWHGREAQFAAVRQRLVDGQDASGGFQTARGFALPGRGRPPPLPDVADVLHVAGWCDKAFRYLARQCPPPSPGTAASWVYEAECGYRGRRMQYSETEREVRVSGQGAIRYHWLKGSPSPRRAAPEFWLG